MSETIQTNIAKDAVECKKTDYDCQDHVDELMHLFLQTETCHKDLQSNHITATGKMQSLLFT